MFVVFSLSSLPKKHQTTSPLHLLSAVNISLFGILEKKPLSEILTSSLRPVLLLKGQNGV